MEPQTPVAGGFWFLSASAVATLRRALNIDEEFAHVVVSVYVGLQPRPSYDTSHIESINWKTYNFDFYDAELSPGQMWRFRFESDGSLSLRWLFGVLPTRVQYPTP